MNVYWWIPIAIVALFWLEWHVRPLILIPLLRLYHGKRDIYVDDHVFGVGMLATILLALSFSLYFAILWFF